MIVEIGHYALVLALAAALIQTALPLWGVISRDAALMETAKPAALAGFLLVAMSYGALTWAYVASDFSVLNVYANSHSQKPLVYRISGVWANHEGSMLLWVSILVLFAAMVALKGREMPLRLQAAVLGVQGSISAAFIFFVLLASNPFERLLPAPVEGRGLNPLLQDPGLAIHPPLLYVGFSIAFSFAVGALIHGRIDAVWARFVRPWTLLAWIFLTAGIAMGSYWAYYELGWGGWWFWDPVENASLMPWLAGTALLHSTLVMEKRDALKVWTILLSILTFSLSLLGAFLVRSGVLTSVHAFATDPARGQVILAILIFFIGGGFALFAWRAPLLKQGGLFAPISREGALVVNNLLLAAITAAVFIGTLYPLALEAIDGSKISVGPPFFEATVIPLGVPLLLIVPVGTALAWKRGDLYGVAQRLMVAAGLALAAMIGVFAWTHGGPVAAPLGIGLGAWLIFGSISEILARSHRTGAGPSLMLRRALGLPLAAWGAAIAHIGVGVAVIGISATAWGTEKIALVRPGEVLQAGPYTVRLERSFVRNGPDFRETVATFSVLKGDEVVGRIEPGKRVFVAQTMPTSEAGLMTAGLGQVYASISEFEPDGSVGVRLYWKPLVTLIWIGSMIMAAGGALSMFDRRARVAAAVRAPHGAKPAGA